MLLARYNSLSRGDLHLKLIEARSLGIPKANGKTRSLSLLHAQHKIPESISNLSLKNMMTTTEEVRFLLNTEIKMENRTKNISTCIENGNFIQDGFSAVRASDRGRTARGKTWVPGIQSEVTYKIKQQDCMLNMIPTEESEIQKLFGRDLVS
jgi:hypothetical protein